MIKMHDLKPKTSISVCDWIQLPFSRKLFLLFQGFRLLISLQLFTHQPRWQHKYISFSLALSLSPSKNATRGHTRAQKLAHGTMRTEDHTRALLQRSLEFWFWSLYITLYFGYDLCSFLFNFGLPKLFANQLRRFGYEFWFEDLGFF